MKKSLIIILILVLVLSVSVAAVEGVMLAKSSNTAEAVSITDDAAAETDSAGTLPEKHILNADPEDLTGIDHADTVYYPVNDYYNMTSNDHLLILSQFETYQQTTSYTCGPSSAYMVLNYLDPELAESYDEMKIAEICGSTGGGVGTSAEQIANFFENECGWTAEYYMSHDRRFTDCETFLELVVKWYLEDGLPIIVDWSISSGHWEVIIGYDDMGTVDINDDVLIFADSADSHDHYQDGYMCFSATRFFSMWKESSPFDGEQVYRQQYVVAYP